MKLLLEAFKSAKKVEILLIIAAVIALLICMRGTGPVNVSSTDEEKRMERILSQIEGAGKVHVMLSDKDESMQRGVIVAARGAEKIEVRLRLQQAVHTLTGLELSQIEVVESER